MAISSEKLFEILKKVERPGRYLGNEVNAIAKDLREVDLKVALVMPETYEIAQSNLGLQILYEIVNKIPRVAAERVYAPWVDLERELRKAGIPIFSLENKIPLGEFDIIGISLPYELSYTNILTLFDLAGIPRWSKDRNQVFPLIIGGGNQAFNPEPIADFFDGFVIGDGEEAIVEIVKKVLEYKKRRGAPWCAQIQGAASSTPTKIELLRILSSIQGFYVPSFFEVSYHADRTLRSITPRFPDYQGVKKATVGDLNRADYPLAPIVPSVKTVHDRLAVEVQRGCVRGCRFCQAGYIYRPERQRSPEKILNLVEDAMTQTGAEEISLLSLSVGDYGCLVPLVRELFDRYAQKKVAISLPATRTDTFSPEIIREIKRVRKTGFTIAPEAGTPHLRRLINKGNSREDLFATVENIFKEGWQLVKFYYMCGLPFERDEDLRGIAEEAERAAEIGRRYSGKVKIHLNLSPHVPKPHTPFQWEAQDSLAETKRKISFLKSCLRDRAVHFKWHDPEQSYLEGVFARGDRRLAPVIEKAWELGCRFEGWEEHFDFEKWLEAFRQAGVDPDFYVTRKRSREEILPWEHLFTDMKKEFLWKEREATDVAETRVPVTEDCSTGKCTVCGVCDYHEVKNINYGIEVYSNPPIPPLSKGGEGGFSVIKFSTRGRKLANENIKWKKFNPLSEGRRESLEASLPKVFTSYRCLFTKRGEAAFLSHLEVMGVLKRALTRVGVPLRFSEGYHPQPYLSLGQPPPVGVESLSEFFDIEVEGTTLKNSEGELRPEDFVGRMNKTLPRGFEVLECVRLEKGVPSISASMVGVVWEVELDRSYPGGKEQLGQKMRWLEAQPELMVIRQRENESRRINIRPFIESVYPLSDRTFTVITRILPQGSARPQEVTRHLLEDVEEKPHILRVRKLDSLLKHSCLMS